ADEKAPLDTRREAVRALGKLKTPKSVATLKAIATAASRDPAPPLAVEAINALAGLISGQPKDEVGRQAQDALEGIVLSPTASVELKRPAVEALAGTRPGTDWLLAIKDRGGLPKEVVADAGRLLRNSPSQAQRNKAMLLFPA